MANQRGRQDSTLTCIELIHQYQPPRNPRTKTVENKRSIIQRAFDGAALLNEHSIILAGTGMIGSDIEAVLASVVTACLEIE